MVKKKSLFAEATEGAKSSSEVHMRGPDPMNKRFAAIAESQKAVRTTTRLVDPQECRVWPRHNRNYGLLNENRCKDLIDSFISQGTQEVPAIVRSLGTKSNPKYEIICGARRFWTVEWLRQHNYPEFKYLVEVRDLTDEQAFRLSNIENLDRKDISVYERAIDYKSALKDYYDGKQKDMADRLRKSEGWVSQYLKLAELPVVIPDAYAEWGDLKIHHAADLLRLLSNKNAMKKILTKATELKAKHQADRIAGSKPMAGSAVLKSLKDAAEPSARKKGGPIAEYGAGKYGTVLTIKSKNQSGMNIHVSTKTEASADELIQAFKEALAEHYS